jgi:3-isopropylmalate/(R)-2-methylmalate dehydratase large subunit
MRFGWTWFRVPESIKFNITGKLNDGIMGRDVYEYILGLIGPTGAIYQVMEFTGPVMEDMSIDGRLSMCCLAMFTGAKLGIVNPDQKVIDWFKARTKVPFEPQVSDPDAKYAKVYEIDGSKIEPQVVVPPHRQTGVKNIKDVEGIKVTNAFIGSCASGRDEDLMMAARILKGRKVHSKVMFNVTPGSSAAMTRSDKAGYISTLLEAGCLVCAPGCGMCPGFYTPLAKNEVCITSSTTNIPGRMGDDSAQVYLGSPATVAASAIEGKITDPRKYL